MLLYATGLLIGHRLQAELALVSADVKLIVLPPPCPLPLQPTDFSRADELIERAHRDARRYLRSHAPASTPLPRKATRPRGSGAGEATRRLRLAADEPAS
jgi:hypothetical protein